jgi:hypothetical protein
MVRSSLRTALALSALWWLAPPLVAEDKAKTASGLGKPGASAAAEKAVRDVLAQFDKGDPGWKVRMEAWARLMKAGPDAVPVLEKALEKESPAARAFVAQALAVMRGPAAIRKAVTDYDLAALDSARLGHVAPDFTLTDLSGKACRLSQFRGKNDVVLTFLADDG